VHTRAALANLPAILSTGHVLFHGLGFSPYVFLVFQ
jgi:hypothetical protein